MEKVLLSVIFITLFSCQPVDNTENYTFTTEDYQFLPTVYEESGKKFQFKNELNEIVEITVTSYIQETEYEGSGFTNNSSHPGNYESLMINLSVTSESNTSCTNKGIAIYKYFDRSLKIYFENTKIPYPCNSGYSIESIQSPFQYTTMSFNGKEYGKIVTFDYGDYSGTPFFHKDYSFDKVYYDLKYGFVGFDDTANNVHFKLTGN